MKRLHIVGCPRSGTTLLMELMATCFSTHRQALHEVSIFDPVPVATLPANKAVYLSKHPTDIFYAHKLLPIDPGLHLLYIVRDPRAVITSVHWSYDGYFTNYRTWKQCETRAQALAGHARFHQLRYEDLVSQPDTCQQQIQQRFPFLAQTHPFSAFAELAKLDYFSEKAMNGLRPVDTNGLTKWHKHLSRVKSQLDRYPQMQYDLLRRTYESDTGWQSMLLDVACSQHQCRDTESPNLLKTAEKHLRVWLKSQRYKQQLACPEQA